MRARTARIYAKMALNLIEKVAPNNGIAVPRKRKRNQDSRSSKASCHSGPARIPRADIPRMVTGPEAATTGRSTVEDYRGRAGPNTSRGRGRGGNGNWGGRGGQPPPRAGGQSRRRSWPRVSRGGFVLHHKQTRIKSIGSNPGDIRADTN